ncbi:MAG: MFS transporter [Pyrinomonadaceae bacterium]
MSAATTTLPVERAPNQRTLRAAQTAAYFVSFIGLGLTTGSLGPTLSALAIQTRVSLGAISYLFMARSLGYVLGSRGGKLFDRLPGNTVLGTTLVLMAGLMALVPLASRFWILIVAMFVLGAAESSLDIGANILLVRTQGNSVGPLLNALHSFFGVGALLSPLVLAAIVSLGYSGREVYFVLSLMLLPMALWVWRLPSPAPNTTSTKPEKINGGGRLAFLIALFLFLYVGAEVSFGGWLFTYATILKITTATVAAYLTSGFWAALTLGRILSVPIARRFRHSSILFVDLAGCLASIFIILLFPDSLSALITGTCGLGLFMASIFPTLLAFADKQLRLTGQMTGGFITGASLGAMLVPLAIGQLFESIGPRIVVLFSTGLLVAMSAVMAMLYRSSHKAVS